MIIDIVLLLLLLSHIADIIRVINNYTQELSQCCAANTDSDFFDLFIVPQFLKPLAVRRLPGNEGRC